MTERVMMIGTEERPADQFSSTPAAAHPRGLYTLFFTEMWERFSYYGMRALLVLFMTDAVVKGGLGLTDKVATSIYGLYTAGVYLAALPGGWVADRFLGAQKTVWYGGLVITCGQFLLVLPRTESFYLGLVLVVLGTGLLKPNISAIVGELYPEGGARRDAGFTIFYMGINLGAAISPLITGYLGEKLNWHYGFAAAGFGMILGLVQFRLTAKYLGNAGLRPGHLEAARQRDWLLLFGVVGGLLAVVVLALTGMIQLNPIALARQTAWVILGVALLYFASAFFLFGLDRVEKKRVAVIAVLFLASAMFWSGFEQAGSSFNLFAARHTQRVIGFLNYEIPAGWLQSLGPIFVISLAPVMAALWVALARRNLNPSLPAKFAIGLLFLGAGFCVMGIASRFVATGHKVWPTWLISTYLLHTFGELCLSPVGLSSVTKLAPRRLVGQMMGLWFLATSFGNLIAGLLAGEFTAQAVEQMSGRYFQIVLTTAGTGLLLLVLSKPVRALMAGVK
ncbi:MAG TPA: peptide MFS transporter [Verrucomicrobiae bacterium]